MQVLHDLKNERVLINLDGKIHSVISQTFFDTAINTIKAWSDTDNYEVMISENPNQPIIIYQEDLGFIIAPRVEENAHNKG